MLIKSKASIKPSEITTPELYHQRRRFLLATMALGMGTTLPACTEQATAENPRGKKLTGVAPGPFSTPELPTSYENVTSYNNFVEFGSDKSAPAVNAKHFKPEPWSVAVEGHCEKPGVYALEDFIKPHQLEERIYRLRCVETWSMVIPWVGLPLAAVLQRMRPTAQAKYVEFTTLYDPKRMPGQRMGTYDWPYLESLRIDEAMHPLTLLAVGLYGEVLPNQNGAPLRLVVPWKYGFKSIKSIVKIAFIEHKPDTTWNKLQPDEYGFYANVNPKVSHPRWSQSKERRVGEWFRRETLMFNGYEEQVAGLYTGMDLRKNY